MTTTFITRGQMIAALTPHGSGTRVQLSGPGVYFERVLPADRAEAYAREQVRFALVRDSVHTAGLAFALKVKTPGVRAKRRQARP